jgi:hypothetical protein
MDITNGAQPTYAHLKPDPEKITKTSGHVDDGYSY